MNFSKRLFVLGVIVVTGLMFASGVFADTEEQDIDFKVIGGELSLDVPSINPFKSIALTKQENSYYTGFDGNFTIKDLRGTQAGWKLEVSATQLTEKDSGHKLPAGSLTIQPPKEIDTDAGAALPDIELKGENPLDDGTTTVVDAGKGEGMGIFTLTFEDNNALGLYLDAATAKEGTYKSTITWNLVTAP